MLTLSKELVPHVERLIPALRDGSARKGRESVAHFTSAVGPARMRDAVEQLQACPAYMFGRVAHELNAQLRSHGSATSITAADVLRLKEAVQAFWTGLGHRIY